MFISRDQNTRQKHDLEVEIIPLQNLNKDRMFGNDTNKSTNSSKAAVQLELFVFSSGLQ
jgi:hypothetical protein